MLNVTQFLFFPDVIHSIDVIVDNGHIEGVKEPKRKKEDCSEDDLNVEAIRPPKKKKKHKTLESVPSEDMEIDGGIHDQLSTPVHHPASDTKLVDKKSRTAEETGSKHGHDDLKSEKKKSKKKKSKSKESESGVVAIKDYTKKRKGEKPDAISLFSSGVQIGSGLESSWWGSWPKLKMLSCFDGLVRLR